MLSLTYLSSVTETLDEAELVDLLAGSRARNEAAGITGLLLYRDGNVIQTLEGPHVAVEETFARIRRDPRHRGVIVLLREEVAERAFPEWSMAFRSVGVRQGEVPGFSDFLNNDERARTRAPDTSAGHLHATFRATMR
ncbi:BLUF domain-containing protein [Nocardioides ferulae]|uniref:BLUF domain-containing protein n=1 Tax=Nocardioides ferulae TaxID=2340821 RepID=UPI0013DE3594|nr:BLUF domain-containing protein [Nocardioides ferulae]